MFDFTITAKNSRARTGTFSTLHNQRICLAEMQISIIEDKHEIQFEATE
jgi:hypothetical protein